MAKNPVKASSESKRTYTRKELTPEQKKQKLLATIAKLKFELGAEGLEAAISQAGEISEDKPYLDSDQNDRIDDLIDSLTLVYNVFENDGRVSLKTALIMLHLLKRDGLGSPLTNNTLSKVHPSFEKITQQFYGGLFELGWIDTYENAFSGRSKSIKFTDRFKEGVLPMILAKNAE